MSAASAAVAPGGFCDIVFFERQFGALCGRHAVNNLLQGPYYTEVEMAQIARELDEREHGLMAQGTLYPHESSNVDDAGNFSINVLREAVARNHGLGFDGDMQVVAAAMEDPSQHDAFLLNSHEHWFTLRKLHTRTGDRWYNLNSMLKNPKPISDFFLSAFLAQMRADGYTLFVVTGRLPNPIQDRSQGPNSTWYSIDQIDASASAADATRRSAASSAPSGGGWSGAVRNWMGFPAGDGSGDSNKRARHDNLFGGAHDEEEDQLQAALQASLAELESSSALPFALGAAASAAPSGKRPIASSPAAAAVYTIDDEEDAELAAALSLSRGDASTAVRDDAAMRARVAYLQSRIPPEPAVVATSSSSSSSATAAAPRTARIQIRLSALAAAAGGGAGSSSSSQPPSQTRQRRFLESTPMSAVFDWAELCWLEASFPAACTAAVTATAAASGLSADGGGPALRFNLIASMSRPTREFSRGESAEADTVGSAGLVPSGSLLMQ